MTIIKLSPSLLGALGGAAGQAPGALPKMVRGAPALSDFHAKLGAAIDESEVGDDHGDHDDTASAPDAKQLAAVAPELLAAHLEPRAMLATSLSLGSEASAPLAHAAPRHHGGHAHAARADATKLDVDASELDDDSPLFGDPTDDSDVPSPVVNEKTSAVDGKPSPIDEKPSSVEGKPAPVGEKPSTVGGPSSKVDVASPSVGERSSRVGGRASTLGEKPPAAGERAPRAVDRSPAAGEKAPVRGEKAPSADEKASARGEKADARVAPPPDGDDASNDDAAATVRVDDLAPKVAQPTSFVALKTVENAVVATNPRGTSDGRPTIDEARVEKHDAAAVMVSKMSIRRAAHGEIDVPELGRIAVDATSNHGKVDVNVSAARERTVAALKEAAPELATSLKDGAIPLRDLNIASSLSDSAHGEPRHHHRHHDPSATDSSDASDDAPAPSPRVRAVL